MKVVNSLYRRATQHRGDRRQRSSDVTMVDVGVSAPFARAANEPTVQRPAPVSSGADGEQGGRATSGLRVPPASGSDAVGANRLDEEHSEMAPSPQSARRRRTAEEAASIQAAVRSATEAAARAPAKQPSSAQLLLRLTELCSSVCAAELSVLTELVEGLAPREVESLQNLWQYISHRLPPRPLRFVSQDLAPHTGKVNAAGAVSKQRKASSSESREEDDQFIPGLINERSFVQFESEASAVENAVCADAEQDKTGPRLNWKSFNSVASASSVNTDAMLERVLSDMRFASNQSNLVSKERQRHAKRIPSSVFSSTQSRASAGRGVAFSVCARKDGRNFTIESEYRSTDCVPTTVPTASSISDGLPLQDVYETCTWEGFSSPRTSNSTDGSSGQAAHTDAEGSKSDAASNEKAPASDAAAEQLAAARVAWLARRASRSNKARDNKITYGELLRCTHEQQL
eukprot:TRINITY_DN22310_c0_g1_i1.p1 TRINITY_DN22310_c0_g1~~TRINITY_DN22310_c0_g1_i1.p1  ORF type:complete len:459 (-),score=78.99 TRINITY_DN22310_c0_g1_i1:11-1387(-)